MDNKFPKITFIYIIVFMAIEWLLQIFLIFFAGNFFNGNGVNELQGVLLTICMFIPAVVLLVFCLFKKIELNELGLKPIKPLFWFAVFGIMLVICGVILLSVLWFSNYPNFIIINGEWKLENVATVIPQPNTPILFLINILLSMLLATIFTIPQALGEELAWRGYLQNIFIKKFGAIKGIIFLGIIWGFFHLPINLAGYNYQETPILGGLVYMTITCISLGAVFGWFRIKTNSVWPAAVAHAAYNVIITIVVMNKPKINTDFYNLYKNGMEIIIGIIFMYLIVKETKKKEIIMSIFVKLYENKIYLKNTKTNIEHTIIPNKPFSHNGLLIANIDEAVINIKNGIKQVMPKFFILKPKIYLLPMKDINEITQTEQYGYIDAFFQAGARELHIIKNEDEADKKR